jgi:hypothetical protein
MIEAKDGGLYRSDDHARTGGASTMTDGSGAPYFSKIYADPKRADTLYAEHGTLPLDRRRQDVQPPARHGDHHGLWIDPAASSMRATAALPFPPTAASPDHAE